MIYHPHDRAANSLSKMAASATPSHSSQEEINGKSPSFKNIS